jgi:hypothetical protein
MGRVANPANRAEGLPTREAASSQNDFRFGELYLMKKEITMKTTKILASTVIALASVAASSAFAQATYDKAQPDGGPLSRSEVQAELAQAKAQGFVTSTTNERANPVAYNAGARKSRADVKAELAQAEASGDLETANERLTFVFEKTPSTRTRADVRAEVIQAKNSRAMALPGTARVPFGTTGRS